jgi:tetratricopeptide (TPR) repeat protein
MALRMQIAGDGSTIELDVGHIRELSKFGRHREALAAAQTLAVSGNCNRDILYLIATNQRCLHRIPEALATLERLEQLEPQQPRFSLLYQERGYCYVSLRDAPGAIKAFLQAVDINPALTASWTMLERLYRVTGEINNAATAGERAAALNGLPPEIVRAGRLFSDSEFMAAESILRPYLQTCGDDVEALRLLARIEHQRACLDEAERLLQTVLKLAPGYLAARLDLARVFMDRQKYPHAQGELTILLQHEPGNRHYASLYAAACMGLGKYEPAIATYRRLLAGSPSADLQVSLGHALQVSGQSKEAAEAYRTAAAARPSFGDAWWSLANLKTYHFSQDDIAQMRAEEAAPARDSVDRCHLCFALGKAYEDLGEYAESWRFYERGNALKRAASGYDPEIVENETRRLTELCTGQFFAERIGFGVRNPDPIFIVGLPRSGSTLIEQILASHSLVEGTQELLDIERIVLSMQTYPAALAELEPRDFGRLGEQYMTDTRAYRSGKPFFIDKMPNNFRYLGIIHLMLPNAKIIDVRREPMACCFSNLKQLFAAGQEFTYSSEDIARYYRNYLQAMRHWEGVLPGRVLRLWYEDVVQDLEGNVRRMFEFCGLDFEPACLDFHRTVRSVHTASSEQVRRPIFRDGLLQWRNYEPWLNPLKTYLDDALIRYRDPQGR